MLFGIPPRKKSEAHYNINSLLSHFLKIVLLRIEKGTSMNVKG